MPTALLILKTILKVALIAVLVFLALILLLLFFPFFYRVDIKGNGSFRIKVNLHWLFYVLYLSAVFTFGEDKAPPLVILRIFGIPIQLRPKKEKKKKRKRKKGEPEEAEEGKNAEENPPSEKPEKEAASEETEQDPGQISSEDAGSADGAAKTEEKESADEDPEAKKAKAPGKLEKLIAAFKDERNKAAIKHLIEELKKLFSHYKPRKIRMNFVFSTGDPANTGKLTGILSLVPYVYQRGNRVIPDFEADKAYLKGKASIRGHMILFFALAMLIRLLKDRNFRRMIRKRKGGK